MYDLEAIFIIYAALNAHFSPGLRKMDFSYTLCLTSNGVVRLAPDWLPNTNFLGWFYDWMAEYLQGKSTTFETATRHKRMKLGISDAGFMPAA